jgi:uncharacterized membrane protein
LRTSGACFHRLCGSIWYILLLLVSIFHLIYDITCNLMHYLYEVEPLLLIQFFLTLMI